MTSHQLLNQGIDILMPIKLLPEVIYDRMIKERRPSIYTQVDKITIEKLL